MKKQQRQAEYASLSSLSRKIRRSSPQRSMPMLKPLQQVLIRLGGLGLQMAAYLLLHLVKQQQKELEQKQQG